MLALRSPMSVSWSSPSPVAVSSRVTLVVGVAAVVGGSLAHLATHYPSGPPAIGASGGVSGLIAAALMIQNGLPAQLLERRFLSASAVFLVGNIVLAFLGPSLFGSAIAWQAPHR